jgi:uncharacterized protein (TIGR02996 family)
MTGDESAFLAAIRATPEDQAPRGAYADWLDEHDRPEEADRQRRHVGAYEYICQFARAVEDGGYDYDEDGEQIEGTLKFDYAEVMAEVEWWRKTVTGEDATCGQGGRIGFSTVTAQDLTGDPATRARFWEAFYVLTGVRAPEELRNQEWYHCAC